MAAQTRSASSRNRGAIICSLSDDLVLHVFSFLQARMLWLMVRKRFLQWQHDTPRLRLKRL